ncbi:acyltransferase family protein [Roseibacillus persicicus]|uniref:acyltransferase family protein n=1 Tax=Roseibacillus persicicus TaxID=454148 RepID=UPI00280F920A|nr:acyltransferase [Roseibacillus persicicus]MDQ8191152.1 acyltransferase [Roseibacillus persicicus]
MPQLNGLRAFCVLVVIFHHWTGAFVHFRFPFEAGAFFFFVLSGFLITRILLHAKDKSQNLPHTYRNFIIRRSLRIFPGYLLILAIHLLLNQADVRENIFWYLFGIVNINFAFHGWQGGADQFWTLAIEQQFYILWGLALLFLPRKGALLLLWLSLLLPCLARSLPAFVGDNALSSLLRPGTLFGQELTMTGKLTWNAFDYIAAGCLYAYGRHEGWTLPKKPALIVGAISALVYLVVRTGYLNDYLPVQVKGLQQFFLIIGTLWVVHLAANGIPGLIGKILEHPITQSIGTKSYGLYLYHNLVGGLFYMAFIQHKIGMAWFPVVFLACSALVWGLASLSWKYLEEPIYKKKSKFPYTRKPDPKAPQLAPR